LFLKSGQAFYRLCLSSLLESLSLDPPPTVHPLIMSTSHTHWVSG
jgi:hypothetical protein